jgi:glycolate oxidase iron-sulfur subunit
VRDIHEWLLAIGLVPPTASPRPEPLRVTYHESCHLCHGQGISSQPRKILNSLPGISLIELTDAQVCCGSAGVYSITQPETSDTLLADKVGHLLETGADMVATANPGCDLQLQRGLKEAGSGMQVNAPITLLAEAYRNSKAPA